MGRGLEKLFNDAPLRPFSDTPDGRTVIELHDRDKKASRFEERSLALQGQTLQALTSLHGGSTVSRDDFLRNQGQTQSLLHDLGRGIGSLREEQSRTSEGIDVLNQLTVQASNRAHGDAVALREGVQGVEDAVRGGVREIHGPRATQSGISDIASTPKSLFEALSAHQKGMLTGETDRELKGMIDDRLACSDAHVESIRDTLMARVKSGKRKTSNDDVLDVYSATDLLQHPSWLLDGSVDAQERLLALRRYAEEYDIPELKSFYNKALGFLGISREASSAPMSQDALVRYSNAGVLTDHMQHVVKAQHREARTGGSLVDINYSMLELLGQADLTNHHLDSIAAGVLNTNSNLIDLKGLVGDFAESVDAGFESVVSGLNRINLTIGLASAAVVASIIYLERSVVKIGKAIQREISYSNRLLERLIWLQENSHDNESRQYFEDGLKCLTRAAARSQVEDAHAAFDDGAKKVRSSVENHYGAGMAAELLGDLAEAFERYHKAAQYSLGDLPEMASISLESLARVQKKQGKLLEAIESSNSAIEADPKNLPARYDQARYLALSGQNDEAAEVLVGLFQSDEKYFLRMIIDPAFQHIGIQALEENLWDNELIKHPLVLRQMMMDFLVLNDTDRAFDIFCTLVRFGPKELLGSTVWIPQLIDKIKNQVGDFLSQMLHENKISGFELYTFTMILLRADFEEKYLLDAFLKELENDPAYYEKNSEKINQNLKKNLASNVEELLNKIRPILPVHLSWLKL